MPALPLKTINTPSTFDGDSFVNKQVQFFNRSAGIYVRYIKPDHWWQKTKWELLQEYHSANGEVVAPVGFISDGVSAPPFVRNWISPTGDAFGAAIVHDYIIVVEKDWKKANKQFAAELEAIGVVKWRRVVMIAGVELWAALKKLVGKA